MLLVEATKILSDKPEMLATPARGVPVKGVVAGYTNTSSVSFCVHGVPGVCLADGI